MRRNTRDNAQGFTLIELSLVLVIIGLVIGGIMVGQNLIQAARLRDIVTQQAKFVTAIATFKSKYGQLPGDFTDATSYWGASSCPTTGGADGGFGMGTGMVTCNGDGDGAICGGPQLDWTVGMCNEALRVWQHLTNAGFLEGTYIGGRPTWGVHQNSYSIAGITNPAGKIENTGYYIFDDCMPSSGSGIFFSNGLCGHVITFGTESTSIYADYRDRPFYAALSTTDAKSIDAKIDDGLPGTGVVNSFGPNGATPTPNCATTSVPATAIYNMAASGLQCSLIFLSRF